MAKNTYTWYKALVKIISGLVTLMGLAIMVVCAYDMVLTFKDTKLEEKIRYEIHLIEKTNSEGYQTENTRYVMADNDKYNYTELDNGGLEQFKGAKTYRIILFLCLGSGIILGFVQFISSSGVVFSCSPDIPGKVKTWVIIHLFVFLLGFLCLVVPLSFNPERGTHFDIHGFTGYLKNKFMELMVVEKLEDFHRHLFYYFVGANELLLFVGMSILGGLLRCGMQPYESVY